MGRRYTPVVIGVGDVKNKSTRIEDAHEPARLMLQSIAEAIKDTKLSPSGRKELQSKIDSIHVVNTWSWAYPNLPGLLAEKLGVNPNYKVLSHHGGDSPAKLFDEAARRVSFGQAKVAIVTGGESLASLVACAAAGKLPPPGWTERDKTGKIVSPSDLTRRGQNLGTQHYIGLPIHVYPLYENAFRAFRNQSIEDNNNESGHLYGEFARVAERNPVAWNFGKPAASEADIKTVSKKNRMICYPYPLLMNAFNNVNLSGTCILTSAEYAKELGIPESHWIYPLGGAGTQDSDNFWERPNFYSSPAISRSLDAGLEASGLTKEDIDVYDLYSCFPIVPKLACHHLKMSIASPPKPITILGGLTSFGGAGNNYSMHAITELVRQLREGKYQNGLVLANGGVITYQHVVCLSSKPRKDNSPYPEKNPLPERTTDWFVPAIEHPAEGEGRIETYTVEFDRDGSPLRGYIVGRMRGSPERFLANHGDESTLMQLANSTKEQIGRLGWVKSGEDGRNLFVFDENAKL